MTLINLIIVLFVANGAPILARNLLGDRFDTPIDFGKTLADGSPLFGSSKTWRGLVAAPLVAAPVAALLGLGLGLGVAIASLAMIGDLATSYVKRRLAMESGDQAFILDQTPESLLPLLAVADKLNLSIPDIAIVTAAFIIFGLMLSRLLFKFGVRRRPH